jgi:hypothetical protein
MIKEKNHHKQQKLFLKLQFPSFCTDILAIDTNKTSRIVYPHKHSLPVPKSNAVINEGTVMIKVLNTSVTNSAVFGPQRTQTATSVTQSGKYYVTFLQLVKVWDLFNGSIVTI